MGVDIWLPSGTHTSLDTYKVNKCNIICMPVIHLQDSCMKTYIHHNNIYDKGVLMTSSFALSDPCYKVVSVT